jgi:hypothetical protein
VVYVSDRVYGNLRSGGVIREKWGIPDGNVESGMFSYSELRRW